MKMANHRSSGRSGYHRIPWIGDPSEVVLLDVIAYELMPESLGLPIRHGFWTSHDDVVFATNVGEIVVSEEPKLHHLKKELESVVEKYGSMNYSG